VAARSGVADEDVEATELTLGALEERCGPGQGGQVRGMRERFALHGRQVCCNHVRRSALPRPVPIPTSAPHSASNSAVAAPMPREPPVTSARFPRREIMSRGPALDELADRVLDTEMDSCARSVRSVGTITE
jgi:hypothetical protein